MRVWDNVLKKKNSFFSDFPFDLYTLSMKADEEDEDEDDDDDDIGVGGRCGKYRNDVFLIWLPFSHYLFLLL